ncbi:unnamed protein product, partial [Scytosiphon promiscuus]
ESQGIDPHGDDGISQLLGAMEEVTVEDKEEENGKRKAKKDKNDAKEGKGEDQGPGSREAAQLRHIVKAATSAKSQSKATGSCGLTSGLVRVMTPAAEDKETRERATKQEERNEDEGDTRRKGDLARVASMTPTSTASVAFAETLPATALGKSGPGSHSNRTCSLKVAYVNMSTAAAAPASVIAGHRDVVSVKG